MAGNQKIRREIKRYGEKSKDMAGNQKILFGWREIESYCTHSNHNPPSNLIERNLPTQLHPSLTTIQ
jgi:hypothetical protein